MLDAIDVVESRRLPLAIDSSSSYTLPTTSGSKSIGSKPVDGTVLRPLSCVSSYMAIVTRMYFLFNRFFFNLKSKNRDKLESRWMFVDEEMRQQAKFSRSTMAKDYQ
jgi:hypothetical protein